MKAGETERIRLKNKDGGLFPIFADINRDELGGYTVTVDNEDRPGTFLSYTENVDGDSLWSLVEQGEQVFREDSEERARTIAEEVVGEQRELFERLYEETPDIDKTAGWELPASFGGTHGWEEPIGLRDRMSGAEPLRVLAGEFGLDYISALIDIDFAGLPRGENPWAVVSAPIDEGKLAGMDTTPVLGIVLPPESGRPMLVEVLAHAGEVQQAVFAMMQILGLRHEIASRARRYHEDGFGVTAFAVMDATPEEIENALLSRPAIRPNRAARRRAKHGRK